MPANGGVSRAARAVGEVGIATLGYGSRARRLPVDLLAGINAPIRGALPSPDARPPSHRCVVLGRGSGRGAAHPCRGHLGIGPRGRLLTEFRGRASRRGDDPVRFADPAPCRDAALPRNRSGGIPRCGIGVRSGRRVPPGADATQRCRTRVGRCDFGGLGFRPRRADRTRHRGGPDPQDSLRLRSGSAVHPVPRSEAGRVVRRAPQLAQRGRPAIAGLEKTRRAPDTHPATRREKTAVGSISGRIFRAV